MRNPAISLTVTLAFVAAGSGVRLCARAADLGRTEVSATVAKTQSFTGDDIAVLLADSARQDLTSIRDCKSVGRRVIATATRLRHFVPSSCCRRPHF